MTEPELEVIRSYSTAQLETLAADGQQFAEWFKRNYPLADSELPIEILAAVKSELFVRRGSQ